MYPFSPKPPSYPGCYIKVCLLFDYLPTDPCIPHILHLLPLWVSRLLTCVISLFHSNSNFLHHSIHFQGSTVSLILHIFFPMCPDSYLQLHWTWSVCHALLQTCQGHFSCHNFWDEPWKWCLGVLSLISVHPFLSFSSRLVSIQNVISFCLNLNTGRRRAPEREEAKLAPSWNLSPGAYLLLHPWAFGRRFAPGTTTAVCHGSRERGVQAGRLGREAWRVALVCPWVLRRGRRTNEMAGPCPGVLSFQTSPNSITKVSNPALDISPPAHKRSMVSTHLPWRVPTSNQGESSKCSTVKHYSFPSGSLHVCMFSCFSQVWFFTTLWTVAHQAPLCMGVSRQEYWSGLPWPSPGDLSSPGIKPSSPVL